MNIGFIGFGSMAKAIARGLLKENKHQLFASSPSLTRGINKEGIHTFYKNSEVLKQAEVIILAVKPSQMDEVIQEINPVLADSCLLISVAAGLSIEWFNKRLSKPQALIRTMPNTPASLGLGATPLCTNSLASLEQQQNAEAIFATVGITHWVNEEKEMDTFTALSGSGPAYMFLFLEALINGAVNLGLNYETAERFALQTCKGALKLAETTDLSLSQLRSQVTSPGGTTAAALNVLDPKLDNLINSALQAAKKRAEELNRLY